MSVFLLRTLVEEVREVFQLFQPNIDDLAVGWSELVQKPEIEDCLLYTSPSPRD